MATPPEASPEATLEDRHRLYETLFESSLTAIAVVDAENVVTGWNPAAERLFGFSQAEAVGRPIDDLVAHDPSILSDARAVNERVFVEPVQRITRRTTKDGTLVDVVIRGVPIMMNERRVGAFAMYEDVGELVRQRRFFESLVEQSPTAIVTIDEDVNVTLWNPGAERLFGYSSAEAIGRNLDDLIASDPDIHAEATAWSAEGMAGGSFQRIGRRTRKDGSLVDVEIVAVSVQLEGEPIGFYIIYHDVTELEQARRRLEARIDEQMAELVRTGELARFLPQQVAEGLLGGRLHAEEPFERRRITVLFADMVGFTDLSESLEPEELAEVLNGYLREMTAAVIAHGGSLDNFIGDGVMAVFGAPQELPEAEQAWAAVEAAMEMRERCHDLATSLRERGIPADPEIRVGLNTAHCTVGVFGSEVMRAYKAVGFGVNVAARLQTAADPGSILCGFRTYALVKDRVTAEERGALSVKGAVRPVEAWEIMGLLDR
ncbi:MAG TPA: PAS domain S-box protein [Actinomycetota bacterium]|nr:PAS domain S-box protein [Actinomycetota bacterium]